MKKQKNKKQREEEKAARKAQADKVAFEAGRARTRKPFDINQEYRGICQEVGDKQYHKQLLEQAITNLSQKLYELNQEFNRSALVYPELIDSKGNAVQMAPPPPPAPAAPAPEKTKESELQ